MQTVHVVFSYTPMSSGAFDWYFKKEDADKDLRDTIALFADCPDTLVWQRTHETELTDCDEITSEIEEMQVEYEDEEYKARFGKTVEEAYAEQD